MLADMKKNFGQLLAYLVVGGVAFGLGYWLLDGTSQSNNQQLVDVQCKNSSPKPSVPSVVSTNVAVRDFASAVDAEQLKRALLKEQQKNQELMSELSVLKQSSAAKQNEGAEKDNKCASLSEKMDIGLSQEAMKDLYSSDLAVRKRVFLALAQLQNTDAKELLVQLAQNEQEDAELRRNVIRSMDWHGAVEQAIQVFNTSKDESVKAAVILAAEDSQLDEIEKQNFESQLTNMFAQETSGFIQIVMLDYFSNKNAEIYSMLSGKVSDGEISVLDDVKKHLNFATTK